MALKLLLTGSDGFVGSVFKRQTHRRQATGDLLVTTWSPCTSCCSRHRPTTTSLPPAERRHCARCAGSRLPDYESCIEIDPKLYRPEEVDKLRGNPAKARAKLGWEPKTDLEALIKVMFGADMVRVARE